MPASANWLALKKNLKTSRHENERPRKRRRLSEGSVVTAESEPTPKSQDVGSADRDSVIALRNMVYGQLSYSPAHLQPGKYLAMDCEMVGIAGDSSKQHSSLPRSRNQGDESSLARVSVVNYHGAVQLDVFVSQRERVTDWRTAVSGIRESDMVDAKSFSQVQKLVADLLKDRILVGHAVHNDLKVLLLSHPHNMTRDTQVLAGRHGTLASSKAQTAAPASGAESVIPKINRKPALRKLVSQELGIEIQAAEHSSIIDARATMAIYRLHRKMWDQDFVPATAHNRKPSKVKPDIHTVAKGDASPDDIEKTTRGLKRARDDAGLRAEDRQPASPVGPISKPPRQKQAISSGLSVVVRQRKGGKDTKEVVAGTRHRAKGTAKNTKWWGTLGPR